MRNTIGARAGLVLVLVLCGCGSMSCIPPSVFDLLPSDPLTVNDIDFSAFPPNFMWGAGTSSHQHEGNDVDSDWWQWELAGRVKNGDRSGIAVDHWNRYEEDFDALVAINLDTYRFSLSWARLFPRPGMTEADPEAAAHYDDVFAALAARQIRPMVTLHHFAMPNWITEQNRWATGEAIQDFTQFARFAAERWGDQCDWWVTINEPHVYALHGWWREKFPPGINGLPMAIQVYFNLMRAHAGAYHTIKEVDQTDVDGDGLAAQVGVAALIVPVESFLPWDIVDRIVTLIMNEWGNNLWFDLNVTGLPEIGLPGLAPIIAGCPQYRGTHDFIGVNYYSRQVVHFDLWQGFVFDPLPTGRRGQLDHEVYPEGLYDVLVGLAEYGLPLIVTETGVADDTDELRFDHIVGHLTYMTRFMNDYPDIPVLGYIHWSLTDHFEWENGWGPRFGLYEVDFETLERTQRPSAAALADLITDIRNANQ